jgi:hypothetical protein
MTTKVTAPRRHPRITAENFPVRLVHATSPISPSENSQRADRFHQAIATLIRLGGGADALTQLGIK